MTSVNSVSSFQRTGNPDKDAQTYATQNGVSLASAKETLKAQFGAPKKPDSIFDSSKKASTSTKASTDSTDSTASTDSTSDSSDWNTKFNASFNEGFNAAYNSAKASKSSSSSDRCGLLFTAPKSGNSAASVGYNKGYDEGVKAGFNATA